MTNANRTDKRRILFSLLSVLGIFLMTATLTWAQYGAGGLAGTVSDPQGAVLPGASVVLTSGETHTNYTGVTNNDGRFFFTDLPSGPYSLKISDPGFKTETQSGITISVGATSTLNVALQVGAATEQVEVAANTQQLQTESSDVASIVQPAMIAQLPLNFSGLIRSPLQFIELTPGFEGDSSGNPQSQQSYKLNGGGTGQADALLDGASLSLASPNYQWNFGISVEAITEFNVQTSTFSAQYGRTGGGFVNVATRGGGDQFHGGVYDILKNRVFDANSWQGNYLNQTRPIDTQNDFGGFVGGPVLIPHVWGRNHGSFFFFSYEGFRYSHKVAELGSVPLAAMFDNGAGFADFSSVLPTQTSAGVTYAGRQVYDYTTCGGEGGCQPFTGNKVPEARADALVAPQKSFLLTPNTNEASPYNNFNYTLSAPINNDLYSLRIDQSLGPKNKLYGSYARAHMPVIDAYSAPNEPTLPQFNNDFGSTVTHYARVVEDWTVSNHMVNHLNAGYTRRFRIEESPNTVGGGWEPKTGFHGDYVDITKPGFGVTYGAIGNALVFSGGNEGFFTDNSYEFSENLTWSKGNHTFQFGIGHIRQGFTAYYYSDATANFGYDNQLSGIASDPNSGFGLVDFFLGVASSGTIGAPTLGSIRARYWDMYAQDDWKISPKFTANVGLRYEIPDPNEEAFCRTAQVSFLLPNPGAVGPTGDLLGAMNYQGRGTGLDGHCSPLNRYNKSWGPRLGTVYALNNATVLRAAYGVYYTPIKVSNFANTDEGGFFVPGISWKTPSDPQSPAIIPSSLKSYPGETNPAVLINPVAFNGLVGGGGAASGGPVMMPILPGAPGVGYAGSNAGKAVPGIVQNWTLDVQRQLKGGWLLDVAYVGNHGDRLQTYIHDPNVLHDQYLAYNQCLGVEVGQAATDLRCANHSTVVTNPDGTTTTIPGIGNLPLPSPTGPYALFVNDFGSTASNGFNGNKEDTVGQAFRPLPQYQTEDLDTAFDANPWGNYTYEALQVKMTKRYGNGLTVLANWTWSKNLGNADSDYAPQMAWNGGSSAELYDPDNPQDLKAISEFDQPSNLKVAYTYELPWGSKRPHMNHANPVVNAVAGNWTLGGIDSYATGYPLWLSESGWTAGTFATNAENTSARPNQVPGVKPELFHYGSSRYSLGLDRVNPAGFSYAPNYTFGNAPRIFGNARYFFHKDEDLQVGKAFPLGSERTNLNFRFDAFNIFNRHSFGCLDNNVGDKAFGQFTCGAGPNAEVSNNITTSVPAYRTMQATLRLTF